MHVKASASIFCESKGLCYRLELGETELSETFESEESAVRRACELVAEETTLTIYGVDGTRLVVAALHPQYRVLPHRPASIHLLEAHPRSAPDRCPPAGDL